MKRALSITIGCLLLMAGLAYATDSISILNTGNTSSGSYAAGSSFTLNMNLTGTNPPDVSGMNGFSLWLAPGSSAWNSFFTVTGKTAGSTFADQNQPLVGGGDAIVATGNTNDLGYTVNGASVADGSYFGGSLQITIGNSVAPGVYTIHTTAAADNNAKQTEISDGGFNSRFVASSTYTITVTAVPEPATWSLFGLGGVASVGLTLLRSRRNA
jgi:hypothetical protein